MVNPLVELALTFSPFGGQIDIAWKLPTELPELYKVYLFKRSGRDITDIEILAYFNNLADLSNFAYNGLFVFDKIENQISVIGDLHVFNDTTYYYKALIRDENTGDLSEVLSQHGIPKPTIKVNILDGKDIVCEAIKKMFDSVYNSKGDKVVLSKDIEVVKNFAVEPISQNYVMIERVNGSTQYRFWGNVLQKYGANLMKGDYDADVIRATFMTLDGTDRRDIVANIFRSRKQSLIQFCKNLGALECNISLEGDYYNPQVHGENALGFIAVINLIIENKVLIPNETTAPISVDVTEVIINNI